MFVALLAASCASPSGPAPVPVPTDPPKISCPAAQAVTVAGSPAVVAYPSPTVVGGSVPVSTVCSPSSGSSFPAGATSVACAVTDSLARSAACSFTVTVTVAASRLSATRYVAFGDSITEGKPGTSKYDPGVSVFHDAYAEVLYNMLVERYTAQTIDLADRGFAGEFVQGGPPPDGVTRLPGVLNADAPQVLLLEEGANDLSGGDPAAVPRLADGLTAMVREARRRGITVFIATLLPQRVGGKRAGGASLVVPANVRIRALAASEGAILVDLYEALGGSPDPWIDPDGLHPNPAGYKKMAETFFAAIRSRLEVGPALSLSRAGRR